MFSSTTKQKANERDKAQETLRRFISRTPNNNYTFDSERDAPQSEICRDDPNNHECITFPHDTSPDRILNFACYLQQLEFDRVLVPVPCGVSYIASDEFKADVRSHAVPWVLLFVTDGARKNLYGM
ncbi:hypothetical protein DFH05DRAFT_1461927 [Lentinula detonsa]|uniref:Uncharacterized protein n=1 Tax=Lentinula detonsa TaxID=2804962 RepID=A0A9W8NW20_9AGAR|nr:hypothetical protein DFH05DRAFT_1461927 [Lentinula detonsa]